MAGDLLSTVSRFRAKHSDPSASLGAGGYFAKTLRH